MNYYARTAATHLDGSPIFRSDADARSEDEVAALVAKAWGCEVNPFGPLSPVDYYALRAGRLVGVLELKTRSHDSGRHPDIWLNCRKWLALLLASSGLGVPGIFVARFTDEVRWISVADIDAGRVVLGGCSRIVKARSDREPVIPVPVAEMRGL